MRNTEFWVRYRVSLMNEWRAIMFIAYTIEKVSQNRKYIIAWEYQYGAKLESPQLISQVSFRPIEHTGITVSALDSGFNGPDSGPDMCHSASLLQGPFSSRSINWYSTSKLLGQPDKMLRVTRNGLPYYMKWHVNVLAISTLHCPSIWG